MMPIEESGSEFDGFDEDNWEDELPGHDDSDEED